MTKPHCHNPKARREMRAKLQVIERQEKIVERRQPKPEPETPVPSGRCLERDRNGHRCIHRGKHEIHRAFGREWMVPE